MSKKSENVGFVCENCGRAVSALTNGSFRNHCPFCLVSKHLDKTPGDRASDCGGLMWPVEVVFNSKKGLQILHRCQKCGQEKLNKVAQEDKQGDDMELIFELMKEKERLCRRAKGTNGRF